MDEDFAYFLSNFEPIGEQQEVPQSAFTKFQGVLPDQLLHYWREVGWCSFANGLFWMVNPDDWDEPMELMLDDTGFLERDAFHVIARNAFGDLWLWGQKTGGSISIISTRGMIFPHAPNAAFGDMGIDFEMQLYFGGQEIKSVDLLDDRQKPLFERAHKKLGPLKANEVYGFVPLPAMGGACELKHLQKLQADVYMDLLARNTPMRVMPDYAAIASGRA
jgi:hypothetical protein